MKDADKNSPNEDNERPDSHLQRRPTVRDIADAAGVHFTTVAKALRGSPGVSEATRKRVKKIADEVGYTPDPMLSALSTYRSSERKFNGTLYWVNAFESKRRFQDDAHHFGDCYRGAQKRCEELGFKLEILWLSQKNLSAKTGSEILRTRNASGVILGPTPTGIEQLDLPHDAFPTVRIGYSLRTSELSTVATNHFGNIRLLYHKLVEDGFQRIGFCCTKHFDQRSLHQWSGSYLAMQQVNFPESTIRPFLDPDPKGSPASFLQWYTAERPEIIISGDGTRYLDILRTSNVAVPDDVQFVSLHTEYSDGKMAGIHQNGTKVGRVAVEHVAGMISRYERGLETDPRTILLLGKWVDGESFDGSKLRKRSL